MVESVPQGNYEELLQKHELLLKNYNELLERFKQLEASLKKKKKKYVPQKRYSKEWFSKEEIKKLFNHVELKTRDRLLFQVAYYGGLRISEALNSRLEDYRNDDYTYLIIRKQKTDKKNWETQPLLENIYAEVIRYCRDNNIKTQDPVFQSNRKQQLSYDTVYKLVKKISTECGIDKKVTTHSFRRSRATHLLNKGLDISKVSRFLRHVDIKTTMRYLKISKKRLSEEVTELDNDVFEEI